MKRSAWRAWRVDVWTGQKPKPASTYVPLPLGSPPPAARPPAGPIGPLIPLSCFGGEQLGQLVGAGSGSGWLLVAGGLGLGLGGPSWLGGPNKWPMRNSVGAVHLHICIIPTPYPPFYIV